MNPAFAEHVTSQAFVLTLSRPMITALRCAVESQQPLGQWGRDIDALVRRGLVVVKIVPSNETKTAFQRVIIPTRAGKKVWSLLRETGQVPGGRPDPTLHRPPSPPAAQIDAVHVKLKCRESV